MKKFVFSVASRATGRLQIKPSGSGDENGFDVGGKTRNIAIFLSLCHATSFL